MSEHDKTVTEADARARERAAWDAGLAFDGVSSTRITWPPEARLKQSNEERDRRYPAVDAPEPAATQPDTAHRDEPLYHRFYDTLGFNRDLAGCCIRFVREHDAAPEPKTVTTPSGRAYRVLRDGQLQVRTVTEWEDAGMVEWQDVSAVASLLREEQQ